MKIIPSFAAIIMAASLSFVSSSLQGQNTGDIAKPDHIPIGSMYRMPDSMAVYTLTNSPVTVSMKIQGSTNVPGTPVMDSSFFMGSFATLTDFQSYEATNIQAMLSQFPSTSWIDLNIQITSTCTGLDSDGNSATIPGIVGNLSVDQVTNLADAILTGQLEVPLTAYAQQAGITSGFVIPMNGLISATFTDNTFHTGPETNSLPLAGTNGFKWDPSLVARGGDTFGRITLVFTDGSTNTYTSLGGLVRGATCGINYVGQVPDSENSGIFFSGILQVYNADNHMNDHWHRPLPNTYSLYITNYTWGGEVDVLTSTDMLNWTVVKTYPWVFREDPVSKDCPAYFLQLTLSLTNGMEFYKLVTK